MQETVVTLIGQRIDDALENRAADAVRQLSGAGVRVVRLHAGRAVDIIVNANSTELTRQLSQKLQNLGAVDIFVQANDAYRKKRLLVADMDATMVVGETLDDLADHLGIKDQIAPITAKAMAGELDFHEALKMRVKLLRGLPLAQLYRTVESMTYAQGAVELIRTMNRFGGKCVLISGGFDFFTRHAAEELGFWKNFGNSLGINNDHLTGEVIPPIVDKDVKKKTLELEARALQIDLRHTMAVGDGANDIPMLQTAGAGVGYFAKPAVIAATPHQVRHSDLTALLYMQGYRAEEIFK